MKRVTLLVAVLSLAGCAVGPDFVRPAVTPEPAPTRAGLDARLATASAVAPDWWTLFGDPILDRIVQRTLAGNLDIEEAGARVARSRAALRIAGAAGVPHAGAAASYMRERASPEGIMGLAGAMPPGSGAADGADPFGAATLPGGNGSPAYDLFQAGFDASWELDLWGKHRRSREAARADVEAALYDREAIRITVSAEVARAYFILRGAEARLAVLERNREAIARGLEIARSREQAGASSRYDAATAATQLAAINSAIPAVEHRAAAARNALALLAGEPPQALNAVLASGRPEFPNLPNALPGGLSSYLARRRPDILSAEAALHAATARIGIAKADFYPSLTLSGSFGTQALDASDLFGWNAHQFLVGPILRLPIFESGRLKGQLELTRADQRAAAIRYRATVLRAWHEVDDALEALHAEEKRAAATEESVRQSRIATHVAERRYRAGATGYLDVLVAERAALEREAEWAEARATHAIAVVALYKSLGGGWQPSGGGADGS